MQGRQLAITEDQSTLTFKKLDKPYLEAPPQLIEVVYNKVDERPDTNEYVFKTVEGINRDNN